MESRDIRGLKKRLADLKTLEYHLNGDMQDADRLKSRLLKERLDVQSQLKGEQPTIQRLKKMITET